MFSVELYGGVRSACHVEGLSQREAARRFGIHRNTVRKMLALSVGIIMDTPCATSPTSSLRIRAPPHLSAIRDGGPAGMDTRQVMRAVRERRNFLLDAVFGAELAVCNAPLPSRGCA